MEGGAAGGREAREPVPVWDRLVRILHWTLIATIGVAWIATERSVEWHERIGYLAGVLVTIRIVWGFIGRRHARFADFVRSPMTVSRYALAVMRHREVRFIGHNPLGGWMVVALIVCVVAIVVTGWLFTTDRFWGEPWLSDLHSILAWTLVWLVVLHVAGVLFTSLRHRENLVRAMIDGRKRAAEGDDVD